ncbi:hypothetical protein BDY19DRAFT_997826 [Irpex rosettiformis]|uniref:Uncharacterized protein n=1 Tax=Irpex rosettiformis TaxID=378272 RepID=A0ACB8TQQ5_9APHY|nr:hypothetical protein BDY19DRAFT_997826 [Irpex rosettiformis]
MHPLRQTLFFALLALSLFQVDVYAAQSGTNAARLAHGQSPVRPKRLYFPGLNAARNLVPSGTPLESGSSSGVVSSSAIVSITDSQSLPTPSPSDSTIPSSAASSAVPPPSSSSASSTPVSSSSSSSAPTPTAPAPGTAITARIGLYTTNTGTTGPYKRDDATFVGYLGAYGVTTETNSAWTYTYTVPNSPGTPTNLNHPNTPYRLSAVAIGSGPQVTLGPGNTIYLEVQNSRASTPPGSTISIYVYDTYAIGYAQTSIWLVDPITGLVTSQWVNPDGSHPETFFIKSGSNVYITGDVNALRGQLGNPTDFTPVELYHLVGSQ